MKKIIPAALFVLTSLSNIQSLANISQAPNIGCETLLNTSWSGSAILSDNAQVNFKIHISNVQMISDGYFSIEGTLNDMPFEKSQGICYEYAMPIDNRHAVAGIRVILNNDPISDYDITGYIPFPGDTNPTNFTNLWGVWTTDEMYRIESGSITKIGG